MKRNKPDNNSDVHTSFFKRLRKIITFTGAVIIMVMLMFIGKGSINAINNIMFFIIILCITGDIFILIYCRIKGIKLFKGRKCKINKKNERHDTLHESDE